MTNFAKDTGVVPRLELRHRLGLALDYARISVSEMADELGVSRNTAGNYLAGRTRPNRAALRVWALRCGVPFEWLETDDQGDPDVTSTDSGRYPYTQHPRWVA